MGVMDHTAIQALLLQIAGNGTVRRDYDWCAPTHRGRDAARWTRSSPRICGSCADSASARRGVASREHRVLAAIVVRLAAQTLGEEVRERVVSGRWRGVGIVARVLRVPHEH